MRYTVKEKVLKGMGYTFQLLFAGNYVSYRKKVGENLTIWLWKMGKTLEVNDWYGCTERVVNFYRMHRMHKPKDKTHLIYDEIHNEVYKDDYFVMYLNRETGRVTLFNFEREGFKCIESKNDKLFRKIMDSRKGYDRLTLHRKSMDMLLEEIKLITI